MSSEQTAGSLGELTGLCRKWRDLGPGDGWGCCDCPHDSATYQADLEAVIPQHEKAVEALIADGWTWDGAQWVRPPVADRPIPLGVYYSAYSDNFYMRGSGLGMGTPFFEAWRARSGEFPNA